MRAVWCGFALGVVWLQQQAALPGWSGAMGLAVSACVAVGGALWAFRGHGRGRGSHAARRWAGWGAVWLAAFCIGFGYAAWRAHVRLAYALPVEWEGRDIEVRGYIAGLPGYTGNAEGDDAGTNAGTNAELTAEVDANARLGNGTRGRTDDRSRIPGDPGNRGVSEGVRFLFNVESTDAPVANFPRKLQLSWIAQDAPLPQGLTPGARWRLVVRLKRAHGNANFGVRDTEAALFARNLRATGYVTRPAAALRLAGNAHGVGVTVDRWRAALRARIDSVLTDAPHRGIVIALAIGAQDAVSAADWRLMRATGTSHLVAISGLHIGFVASLAAWLASAVWRRSGLIGGRFGTDWPLLLPAQKVAAPCGAVFAAGHAALAGFNVPAQRALWMLAVVALAYLSGRTVARSVVLAWALGLVLLIDPWAVLSAGFWLSFCAVAAILFAMSGRVVIRGDDGGRHADSGFDEHGRVDASRTHRNSDACRSDAARALSARETLERRGSRIVTAVRTRVRNHCRVLAVRIRSGAHVQLAVTVALAPLTAYWFAQIPLVGPLANAFAIPWVSVLVTPLVLAGVALPAPLDALAFSAAHRLLDVLVASLHAVSGPAWALWRLPQPDAWALAAAAVGVAWCLAPRGWPLRWA
ncbi:ComEC/Rec2 family competence protein, partial [Paraburkholderia solisilvae]